MQPTPYERTVAALRIRFTRQPIAATAVALACLWIAVNVYETAAHWRSSAGWFEQATTTVTFCGIGVIGLAAITWLVERVFGDA